MLLAEFLKRYGTRGWRLPIEEFIKRAPPFADDDKLANLIGVIIAELEAALESEVK